MIKPGGSLEEHIRDTIAGSDWLSGQDAVEAFANEAPLEVVQLEHWRCPWRREPDGRTAVRQIGGTGIERT